jgi:DNA-binding XRE family transcriptional regulator
MTNAQKLKRIVALMASPDVLELEALSAEVEAFEKIAFPIALPSIATAMNFRRNQMDENQKQISFRAGISLNRWKKLEAGKCQPSIADACKLYAIGIPASVLLQIKP